MQLSERFAPKAKTAKVTPCTPPHQVPAPAGHTWPPCCIGSASFTSLLSSLVPTVILAYLSPCQPGATACHTAVASCCRPLPCRAHTPEYVHAVQAMSADDSKAVHCIGDESHFMPGGYDLAALAAGGAITATESVLDGRVRNAYALCRCVGCTCGQRQQAQAHVCQQVLQARSIHKVIHGVHVHACVQQGQQ